MLEVYVNDETDSIDEQIQRLLTDLLAHAAAEENMAGQTEVSVTFMSDQDIQKVNAEYRGIDAPTDVISFALEETTEDEIIVIADEDMPTILGDILISTDTAQRQAEEYGHDLKREIGFLALHGFLHLLGYDHMNEEDEARMFGKQKAILDSFGLER